MHQQESAIQPEMTIGQKIVRCDFNPSANPDAESLKLHFAKLIDHCDGLRRNDPRLAAICITKLEEASMWAVKLVTA